MYDNTLFDGEPNRRQLLKGAAGMGAAGLLSGCLGRQRYQPNRGITDEETIIRHVYPSYFDTAGTTLIDRYNENAGVDFTVAGNVTTAQAVNARSYYLSQFNANSARFDVGSMDVIWSGEFVENGWVNEVNDPEGYLDEMIDPAVDAVTVNGTAYAMPLHTDANVLFYRTDLLQQAGFDSPPTSYTELVNMVETIKEQSSQDLTGYIWQGGANEGLTINWLNWLWGMDGSVFDESGTIRVNSQKGVDALKHAVDLIQEGVSPESVQTGSTAADARTFGLGNTIFMRNFPFAIRPLKSRESFADKFDVAPLPTHEDFPDASNSCLGGWNLFVNKNSYNEQKAAKYVSYVGSKSVQKSLNTDFSLLPVRRDIYEEADDASLLDRFGKILDKTRRRPLIAKYQLFSEILYTEANRALRQEKSPRSALNDAQEQIEAENIGQSLAEQ